MKRHSEDMCLPLPKVLHAASVTSLPDAYQVPVCHTSCRWEPLHGIEQLLSIKEPSIEVVLLDDAFQHRYVKPGLSILLTDYHRLFCDDTLLPAGRLRESVNGKNRAQIVIVTKCPQDIKPIDYNIITKRLNLYPYQQLYFSSFRYGNLQPVFPSANSEIDSTVNELPLSALTNTDILLVTGIASPALFSKSWKCIPIRLIRFHSTTIIISVIGTYNRSRNDSENWKVNINWLSPPRRCNPPDSSSGIERGTETVYLRLADWDWDITKSTR